MAFMCQKLYSSGFSKVMDSQTQWHFGQNNITSLLYLNLKLKTSNFVHLLPIILVSLRVTNCPSNGHDRRQVTNFKFWGPSPNSEMTEATIVKFCTHVGHIKLVVLE